MSPEEMLAVALRDNPDIRVAEAKLRESESELNRIRLEVSQKVMAFPHDRAVQQAKVEEYEARLKAATTLYEKQAISEEDLRLAKVNVEVTRRQLSKLEAELPYLLGKAPQGTASVGKQWPEVRRLDSTYSLQHVPGDVVAALVDSLRTVDSNVTVETSPSPPTLRVQGTPEAHALATAIIKALDRPAQQIAADSNVRTKMLEKIRKALDTPIKVEYKEAPLGDVLKDFQKAFGTPFISETKWENWQNPVTLSLGEVPLGLALEAVHDTENIAFNVRDYGILVNGGGAFPGGGGSVLDLWKAGQQGFREDPEQGSKK
jgi:hypothetical protein